MARSRPLPRRPLYDQVLRMLLEAVQHARVRASLQRRQLWLKMRLKMRWCYLATGSQSL